MKKPYARIGLIIFGWFCLTAIAIPQAQGSSVLDYGRMFQSNVADGTDRGLGYCSLYTTPHEDIYGYGRFLLILGDDFTDDGYELELLGDLDTDSQGNYTLVADDDSAEKFLQLLLGSEIGKENLDVNLFNVNASISIPAGSVGDGIKCQVRVAGNSLSGKGSLSPVRLFFHGDGQQYNGALSENELEGGSAESTSMPTAASARLACDNPRQSDFHGWDPGGKCGGNNCLLPFAGYKWWTSYHWNPKEGYYEYWPGEVFSPRNASVDSEGHLHLFVKKDDLGGGLQWAASEIVLAQNMDGSTARLGYGTYLVAARILSAPSWNQMDRNVTFGAFPYDYDSNGTKNPHRELDLTEISRWGHEPGTACTEIPETRLCDGNAQFTVQDWQGLKENLHRFDIPQGVNEITLVMEWKGPQQPVTFKRYDHLYEKIDALPGSPDYEWTTSAAQNPFIPEHGCEFFHLNFFMGNYRQSEQIDGHNRPPPANGQPQEVVVTAFEHKSL